MAIEETTTATVRQKVGRELRAYAVLAAYLFLCFVALILYKRALLQTQGIPYSPFGIAAVKALVLGKFILLGHAVHLGEIHGARRLIHVIALKSVLYLLLLIALSVVEEAVLALIHGRTIAAAMTELWQILATSLVMLLILIPYLAFREINQGKDGRLRSFVLQARSRP